MLNNLQKKTVWRWANDQSMFGGKLVSLGKIFDIGDSLKNAKRGKSLAIIAPSHLMRTISKQQPYCDLMASPNIDKMVVNKGMRLPHSNLAQFYLPLAVHGPTNALNQDPTYVEWVKNFKGLVMHGMFVKDSTNPYTLASPREVKDIIQKCPNTEFIVWRHHWGDYIRQGTMSARMCEFPHYKEWTPAKIPWAHCGAISGFAIPLAMAMGYSKIYLVCMGYNKVLNSCIDPPNTPILSQLTTKRRGLWTGVASVRFKNQSKLASTNGVIIKVGPQKVIEPILLQYYRAFDKLEDIING